MYYAPRWSNILFRLCYFSGWICLKISHSGTHSSKCKEIYYSFKPLILTSKLCYSLSLMSWPALGWLVSSIGQSAAPVSQRPGFQSRQAWFFQVYFYNCLSVVFITARTFPPYILHLQFKYMISYIHYFIFIFPALITNQFNDQLSVGLLAQLVRALHRYRRGQDSSPGKPYFFRFIFTTA